MAEAVQKIQVLSVKETMPLFNPKYQKKCKLFYIEDLQKFTNLKVNLKQGNFSQQTNKMAEDIITKDISNYNAWYCKKQHILGAQIQEKLIEKQRKFANLSLGQKGKSFQVWQQKRFLTEIDKKYAEQLLHIQAILLSIDHKNYHAWSYRIWIITQSQKYEEQLPFSQIMIDKDNLNNSAWSYRFFLIENIVKNKNQQQKDIILAKEVSFTLQKISQAKSNKASWNYLRGLFPSIKLAKTSSKNSLKQSLIDKYSKYPLILESCLTWLQEIKLQHQDPYSVYINRQIYATLVHIYSQKEETKHKAIQMCQKSIKIDKLRIFYWNWIKINL